MMSLYSLYGFPVSRCTSPDPSKSSQVKSKTMPQPTPASNFRKMSWANGMRVHHWLPCLDLCISMSAVLNTVHMWRASLSLCMCGWLCVWRLPWGVWYYPARSAPGSASITASDASPGEHDITHTYSRSHRGDPHWAQISPCISSMPAFV